jgi:DNA-directed RNA polymerase specialized sigma24 family protein
MRGDEGSRDVVHDKTRENEAHERRLRLVLCQGELTENDAAQLRELFPAILAAHHDEVRRQLARRGLGSSEVTTLVEDVFFTLHDHILENGFPAGLPALLHAITTNQLLNHLRARRRAQTAAALPSADADKPERVLALLELAQRLLLQLAPEQREALDAIVIHDLSHGQAASVLGLAPGMAKTRLIAAKRALLALAEPFLPPGQDPSRDEDDHWIYLDGPEPERIRPLLEAVRNPLAPATPEEKEQFARRFFERLDAAIARRRRPAGNFGGEPREIGATERSPTLEERPEQTLPADAVKVAPVVEVQGAEPASAGPRASEGPQNTAMALELPPEVRDKLGRLPFRPVKPGEPPPGHGVARTVQVPVYGRAPGMTAPLGDDAIARAVAALPFVKSTAGAESAAGAVSFPRLSLEQYASLRAELSARPEDTAEIMKRYHVLNEAAWAALEQHWEKVFAARPEERAAFEKAVGEFVAWLRSVQR